MQEIENVTRRTFIRLAIYGPTGACVGSLSGLTAAGEDANFKSVEDLAKIEWGFIVDTTRCIGCGSCVRACKNENGVPDTYFRTWVERYEIDADGVVHVDSPNGAMESFRRDRVGRKAIEKGFFVPKLCNHCRSSSCTQVCPVGASFHSPDGVVLIDKAHCVGCGYCVQACPYGCRYIDHRKGTADKCTLCYHRIQRGMETACVEACPREARICGDLRDPDSRIRTILRDRRYAVLKPDLGTDPKCYYLGLDLEVR